MKRIVLVTLTLSLCLIFSACSDGSGNAEQSHSQSQASSVKKMSEEARLSSSANRTDDGRVVVTGETNLPDSTELLISLSNEAVGFTAQDKST